MIISIFVLPKNKKTLVHKRVNNIGPGWTQLYRFLVNPLKPEQNWNGHGSATFSDAFQWKVFLSIWCQVSQGWGEYQIYEYEYKYEYL